MGFGERVGVCRRVAAVLGIALVVPVAVAIPSPGADASERFERLAGDDRVLTSIQMSGRYWTSADDVVLARADDFPDALAGGALAASLDAPLLLTPRAEIPDAVTDELRRLGARRVHLLGGTTAVSESVETDLRSRGLDVRRLAGADRFETAAKVADAVGRSASGQVVMALGVAGEPSRAWPDALSAGALAATEDRPPLVLVRPDSVPGSSQDALRRLVGDDALLHVVGGPVAIAESVVDGLQGDGFDTWRHEGRDRYGTSTRLADAALRRMPARPRPLIVATGSNYPDGLAAAAMAARVGGILLLVPGHDVTASPGTLGWIQANSPRFDRVIVVGGTAAISDATATAVARAAAGPITKLPVAATTPGGTPAAQALALARSAATGDPDEATGAMMRALALSGFTIVDSRGRTVLGPQGPNMGLVIDAHQVEVLASTINIVRTSPFRALGHEVAEFFDGVDPQPVPGLMLADLRSHARDSASPVHFWAAFIRALGIAREDPQDLLDVGASALRLSAAQEQLLLLRVGADVVAHSGRTPTSRTTAAARTAAAGGASRPCALTDAESTILDYAATGATTASGKLLEYLADTGWKAAKGAGTVIAAGSGILTLGQLITTMAATDAALAYADGTDRLVRTTTTSAGEARDLWVKVSMNVGDWQAVNCMRTALNLAGLDFSLPNDGPMKDVGVEMFGRGELPGGGWRTIQGQRGETFQNKRTSASGTATFQIEGRPQSRNLGANVTPYNVNETAMIALTLKPASVFRDFKDAALTAASGPLGLLIGTPTEILMRTSWLSSSYQYIPVRDWAEYCGAPRSTTRETSTADCQTTLTGRIVLTAEHDFKSSGAVGRTVRTDVVDAVYEFLPTMNGHSFIDAGSTVRTSLEGWWDGYQCEEGSPTRFHRDETGSYAGPLDDAPPTRPTDFRAGRTYVSDQVPGEPPSWRVRVATRDMPVENDEYACWERRQYETTSFGRAWTCGEYDYDSMPATGTEGSAGVTVEIDCSTTVVNPGVTETYTARGTLTGPPLPPR